MGGRIASPVAIFGRLTVYNAEADGFRAVPLYRPNSPQHAHRPEFPLPIMNDVITLLLSTKMIVLTRAAKEFVTETSLQAVSGNPIRSNIWDKETEAAMGHIELARWAAMPPTRHRNW